MADMLLELSRRPQARRLIKSLGLPIPMPPQLVRPTAPRGDRPLDGRPVAVAFAPGSALTAPLAAALAEAGATVWTAGAPPVEMAEAAEAFGRPTRLLDAEDTGRKKLDALIFDGTALGGPEALGALYEFFHPLVRELGPGGRAVVLSRPVGSQASGVACATQAALEGFTRSLSKEVGRGGATALLVEVAEGAEDRLAGPLRFALSARSAYVTGQPLRIDKRVRVSRDEAAWTRPLDGKVALVTGAARGIGRAAAELLAAEGARVYCLDRPEDQAEVAALARKINGVPVGIDITATDAAPRIAEALGGAVDVIVHNAGITRDKTLARMSREHWDQTVAVNLSAVARITDHFVEEGVIRSFGRIVCLSSVSGIAGNMGQTNYGASKAGVVGYVRGMAGPLARRGITINAVAPGFIETRLTDAMPAAIREVARRMNSLGQGGQPQDVGEAIVFLSTPQSAGITGQVLRVCGGALVGA